MVKRITKRFLGTLMLVVGLVGAKAFAIENPMLASAPVTDNEAVYGLWGGFPELSAGPISYAFQVEIRPGKVLNRVTCKFPGNVELKVDVGSRANITDSQIAILDSASNSVSKDGMNCQASISPTTLDYSASGDRLTVSSHGESITLDRIAP